MSYETKVINGSYGSVWVDDEKINECFGLRASIDFQREEVKMCGDNWTHQKLIGFGGKGTIRLNKVTTRFAAKIAEVMRTGKDTTFEIQSMLADPDALGRETVVLKNVRFDDLTLADWEAKKAGTVEAPFTFAGFEYVDTIDATV